MTGHDGGSNQARVRIAGNAATRATAARPYLRCRLGAAAADFLHTLNERHPWSHNDHFHGWILRRLPTTRRAALDVGCGRGLLVSRLASHFGQVHGTDLNAEMRAETRMRCAALPNVTIGREPLAQLTGPYDLITMVAVLHHLDEASALRAARRLLAPGGRLLIVGLAPPVTLRDHAWDIASALTNPLIGLAKHTKAQRERAEGAPVPVAEPRMSFRDLKRLARQELPGARMKHHLAFRYTLEWTHP